MKKYIMLSTNIKIEINNVELSLKPNKTAVTTEGLLRDSIRPAIANLKSSKRPRASDSPNKVVKSSKAI